MHISEVPLAAVLDRIGSQTAAGNDYADHVHMNASARDLQGYVDAISLSLLASPRLDLGSSRSDLGFVDWISVLSHLSRKFFVFYAANPISGIRARFYA